MKRYLLIAEKPSLMKTIQQAYKRHEKEFTFTIEFMAQAGHLVRLISPDAYDDKLKKWDWDTLPIFPENYGGWKYEVIPDKRELINKIGKGIKSGDYDAIISAGDPDEQGCILINLVLEYIKNTLPVFRFWSNDITEGAVIKALHNLRDNARDPFLVNMGKSGIEKQHSDWLLGMNISRAATLKLGLRTACGRVKSPLLKIVVDREKVINNFRPDKFYELQVDYEELFTGTLFNSDGNLKLKSINECKSIREKLNKVAIVIKAERRIEKIYSPPLYKLATLQIAASKLGFNADKTLEIAQHLYEKQILSYPRTSCEFIGSTFDYQAMIKSASVFTELQEYTKRITLEDINEIKKNSKYVNDIALQEAGHYAMTPTEKIADLSQLTEDEKTILYIIFRQFIAMFLPPLVQDKTVIITENKGYLFKSTGRIIKEKGFTSLIETKSEESELPEVREGEHVHVLDLRPVAKETTCPKRFTDGDLIQIMENPVKYLEDIALKDHLKASAGIGTPATRTSIINQLIKTDCYMERKKGKGKAEQIYATEKGIEIIEKLGDRTFFQVDLTAHWEEKLDMIRTGKMEPEELREEMGKYIKELIQDIKQSNIQSTTSGGKKEILCPICGKQMMIGQKSIYCSGNTDKSCEYGITRSLLGGTFTEKDIENIYKGKSIKMKLTKDEKTWEQTLKLSTSFQIEFVKQESIVIGNCPLCTRNVVDTEKYYKCVGYKENCNFIISHEYNNKAFDAGKITKENMQKLLEGKTVEKQIKWLKSGKSHKNKIKLESGNLKILMN